MDNVFYNDYTESINQSPLFFFNLSESEMNNSFDKEDNSSYHGDNGSNFQFPDIDPNYNYNIEYKSEVKTDFKTVPNLKNFSKKLNNFDFYTLDDIKQFLETLIKNKYLQDSPSKIIGKIISMKEEEENMDIGKNININYDKKMFFEQMEEKEKEKNKEKGKKKEKEKDNYTKKKRGRKNTENGLKKHDQYASDNIIKKNKSLLINECRKFINSILNEDKILKINYKKYINTLNKKKNLELLDKSIKDLFSLDVSKRYSSKNQKSNTNLINAIFSKDNEEKYYDDTIKFLFTITLNDWIDLFTYKTDIPTLADKHKDLNVDCDKIQNNFKGVEHFLKDISENNNCYYYSLFLLHIFNYQRWFYKRRGRNHKKKEE